MEIISRRPEKYTVQKINDKFFNVVKILKEGYESHKEAVKDLAKLAVGEITEQDLLGSDFKQDMEAGKQGNRVLVLEAALKKTRHQLIEAMGSNPDEFEQAAREIIQNIDGLIE